MPRQEFVIVLSIIAVKMIAHYFIIHPVYDLQRDEYLHLDQANHLAWGYESVPPFTSWTSYIIKLLGNGIFWIKFFPALFGAATIVIAWKLVELLNGNLFAKIITGVGLLFSVLFRINILYQPNSFDILSWTLVYYFIIRYIQSNEDKWLYWMTIFSALGFLNKYSILFLFMSLLIGLIATNQRTVFKKPSLYVALCLGLLMVVPNLVWQYQHGFPVVHHMKELAHTQLIHVKRSDFIKDQLLFFFQVFFLLIAGIAGFLFYEPFKKYRFVLVSYLCCILLFLYFRAKSYYALGLYPVLIPFGAVYLEYLTKNSWQRYLRPLSFIIIIVFFYPFFIRLPLVPPQTLASKRPFSNTGPHIWEDGKDHGFPQDYADMLGWQELAQKTDSTLKTLPANERTLIRTDNYGQAGAINFYKHLSAVSYNADYINWINLDQPIKNMIIVINANDTNRAGERPYFEKVYAADSITNPFAREFRARIYVLFHATTSINEIIKADIAKEKNDQQF